MTTMKMFSRLASLLCASLALNSTVLAAEPIPLRAGPVTMQFDADNAFLRYIRVGPHEVLRGINAPIRDQSWATIAPQVSNLRVDRRSDSFDVNFDVQCRQADIDFRWKGSISGTAQGVIEFTFDGAAHASFRRNRIGFCVLHGPSAAGQPWVIETATGEALTGRFPKYISAHQPAKNLRAITHEIAAGIRARVDFEGEVFEMEDQRNWTDASFKTYCTPLAIPYPVEVAEGTKVSQKITIRLTGDLENASRTPVGGPVLTIGSKQSSLPRIGVQLSSEQADLTDLQRQRLQALRLDHLRVDLSLSEESFVQQLRRATNQAKALNVSLHIGLHLGPSPAFETLQAEIARLQPSVAYWLVTGGDSADFQLAYQRLAPIARDAKIGVTRNTNFVDLNRARPTDESVAAIGFAINPQIHAFDEASMVETLPIHAIAVNSARQFAGNRPLVIGPITLAPQLVHGEIQPGGPPAGAFPTYVDVRQGTQFTAAWTLASVKYLADAGAASATYYETVGWNGIMDVDQPTARPAAFPSRAGEVFPVYQLFREIGDFAGAAVRHVDSTDRLAAVGLALYQPGRLRVLVGNLTAKPQVVTLRRLAGEPVTFELLGGQQRDATPELRISLPPYGVARIDRAVD